MRRRDFLSLLGAAAVAKPPATQSQQRERRLGVLMGFAEDDPEGRVRLAALVEALQKLGWTDGGTLKIDVRWAVTDADLNRCAGELVALAPDVTFASVSVSVAALQRITSNVPIVFANVVDPVGAGFVASLSRPGGNTTGFSTFEYSLSGKWLEVLKEIAPQLTRVAVLRDPSLAVGIGQFAVIQAMAPASSGLELTTIDVRRAAEIERAFAAFASERNGGFIVTVSPASVIHRDLIISLALQYRLPGIYPFRYFCASGGLASFGPDPIDQLRRAAAYVDRILKGEKPADLAVQTPDKYNLTINLQTAKKLGISMPATLLARADEVIE